LSLKCSLLSRTSTQRTNRMRKPGYETAGQYQTQGTNQQVSGVVSKLNAEQEPQSEQTDDKVEDDKPKKSRKRKKVSSDESVSD